MQAAFRSTEQDRVQATTRLSGRHPQHVRRRRVREALRSTAWPKTRRAPARDLHRHHSERPTWSRSSDASGNPTPGCSLTDQAAAIAEVVDSSGRGDRM